MKVIFKLQIIKLSQYVKCFDTIKTNFTDLVGKNGQKCLIIIGQYFANIASVTSLKVGHSHHRARAKHEGT